jgi:hypothetical protein
MVLSFEKFENRLVVPTILLFLCFEQLTKDPFFYFELHTSNSCCVYFGGHLSVNDFAISRQLHRVRGGNR